MLKIKEECVGIVEEKKLRVASRRDASRPLAPSLLLKACKSIKEKCKGYQLNQPCL